MSVSAYASNKILDRNFGGTSFTVPTTYYIGLSTTAPAFDGTGITEPSGGAYARVAMVNNKTNWSNATLGILENLTSVEFAESTASWGTITHVFISDALTSGNMWYYEALDTSRTVADSTTVLFAASGISIQMDNS